MIKRTSYLYALLMLTLSAQQINAMDIKETGIIIAGTTVAVGVGSYAHSRLLHAALPTPPNGQRFPFMHKIFFGNRWKEFLSAGAAAGFAMRSGPWQKLDSSELIKPFGIATASVLLATIMGSAYGYTIKPPRSIDPKSQGQHYMADDEDNQRAYTPVQKRMNSILYARKAAGWAAYTAGVTIPGYFLWKRITQDS